jgi:hypothetical protein
LATSFSHSLRVLEADKSRAGWLGLLVMMALSGLWLAWGLWGQVILYETTEQAHLAGGTAVVAYFSPAARAHLRPGQPALLRLDGYPWPQYSGVPATVSRVSRKLVEGQLEVRLTIQARPASPISLQPEMPGTVEVEIGQVSPATLLLRAVGQWAKEDTLEANARQDQEVVQ